MKSILLKCFKHFNYSNKFGIFWRMLCILTGQCLPLQQQHTDFNYEILFWFMKTCALTNCSGDCVWFLNSNSFLLRINATEFLHNIRRYLAKSINSRYIREGSLFQPPGIMFYSEADKGRGLQGIGLGRYLGRGGKIELENESEDLF